MKRTQICAHRGFSHIAPENTLAAFQKAIEVGADGIELDVQMTKDGHLVVIHDEWLNRTTTGQGWVKDHTLKEIRELSAGLWFDPSFADERVPTLEEVFELIEPTSLWVNVELKNNIVRYPQLEEQVIALMDRFQIEKRVILSTFNHYSLKHLHQYRSQLSLGVLYSCNLYEPWNYAIQLGTTAIHPFFATLDDEIIEQTHLAGISIRTYTVDEPVYIKQLLKQQIDTIITNDPATAIELRENPEHSSLR